MNIGGGATYFIVHMVRLIGKLLNSQLLAVGFGRPNMPLPLPALLRSSRNYYLRQRFGLHINLIMCNFDWEICASDVIDKPYRIKPHRDGYMPT